MARRSCCFTAPWATAASGVPQLDALASDFTLVAWDAPGCGGSFDPPEDAGLGGYADYLAAFISRLGLDTPHVMGLSFGSGVALELFRRHPGQRAQPRPAVGLRRLGRLAGP